MVVSKHFAHLLNRYHVIMKMCLVCVSIFFSSLIDCDHISDVISRA